MLLSYLALFVVAVAGIVVFDDDPTAVSREEWIFYAIMLYAAVSIFRLMSDQIREHIRRGGRF